MDDVGDILVHDEAHGLLLLPLISLVPPVQCITLSLQGNCTVYPGTV